MVSGFCLDLLRGGSGWVVEVPWVLKCFFLVHFCLWGLVVLLAFGGLCLCEALRVGFVAFVLEHAWGIGVI